jgi:hypothetical protein
VPLHHVPAEPVAGAQRQLQVDLVADLERGERGTAERLGHDLGRERAVLALCRREADAVHGDRVARPKLAGERRLDLHAAVRKAAYHALAGYEPREHLTTP